MRGLGNGKKGMRVMVVDGVTSRERKSHIVTSRAQLVMESPGSHTPHLFNSV